MSQGVAITGMGMISAIGNNVAENYNSLISGKTGISRITKIQTAHENNIMVGEVSATNEDLEQQLQLPSNTYSRTPLLGIIAAKEALNQAGISDINKYRTGLISGTTVGGMDKAEQYFFEYFESDANWVHINALHAGDSTQKIAKAIGLRKSFVTTISNKFYRKYCQIQSF